MVNHRHRYAVNIDASTSKWEHNYEGVCKQAEHLLKKAIANDGRYPLGTYKVVHVQGLMPPFTQTLSTGDVWLAGYKSKDWEWRDEEFCDPDLVDHWRITFVIEAADPPWSEAELK